MERSGFKYGKVSSTFHYHHTTDNPRFESDEEKKGVQLVFKPPTTKIYDRKNWEKRRKDFLKAVIKYLHPDSVYVRNDALFSQLVKLEWQWIKDTSPDWYNALKEYKKTKYWKYKLRKLTRESKKLASNILQALRVFVGNLKD